MYSGKRIFGNKGEDIACKYLESKGFKVIERNFLKKYGEIDIVAINKGIINFFEVKTVSRERLMGGNIKDDYRPEDNIHQSKLKRLGRVIQVYLEEKNKYDADWVFSIITVKISEKDKVARVKLIEDVLV